MSDRNLTDLFAQLGLCYSPEEITKFINNHQLAHAVSIDDAPFFNDAQLAFIRESWLADAEWVCSIEQLNVALHRNPKE